MKVNDQFYGNSQLKACQDLKEGVPSSFAINKDYFNERLVRIKQKIDGFMKQHMNFDIQSRKQKFRNLSVRQDQSGSSITSQTATDSFGRPKQLLSPQKITEQMKKNIQKIYNEIYLLEMTATKDEHVIETNTFQLKYFLKDLRNQQKRLKKILPDGIIFQLEVQKKKTFNKNQIVKGEIETIVEDFQTAEYIQKQEGQQKNLQLAKQQTEQLPWKGEISDKNIEQQADTKNQTCEIFQCQLI